MKKYEIETRLKHMKRDVFPAVSGSLTKKPLASLEAASIESG